MESKESIVEVREEPWGNTSDGSQVRLFHLRNNSLEIAISNYGARLVRVKAPDRRGEQEDIVFGFDTLEEYEADTSYMGATVGRFANRIAYGRFELDGVDYFIEMPPNTNHALHGGTKGFDRWVWTAEALEAGVSMKLISPAGDMGFPGTVQVEVCYLLKGDELHIVFEASTDKTTILNLTNHGYFNLNGNDRGDILSHEISILANAFTPIDNEAIPTGEVVDVEKTPFDLRLPRVIGEQIAQEHSQIRMGDGFNHNFVLDNYGQGSRKVARVYDSISGRSVEVITSQPGLQLYTGNALSGAIGRHGQAYTRRKGLCLETQHFPDSPHHQNFPSTKLRPDEPFTSLTIYKFGWQ